MGVIDWVSKKFQTSEKAASDASPTERPVKRRYVERFVFPFDNVDSGTEFSDIFFERLDAVSPVDLSPERMETAQRLSMLLYRKNVRAFCAIELVKDFVLGDGIKFKANDPKVQELLDEHWEVNAWEEKLEERVRALAIFGEQLYPVFINEGTGLVRISSVTPFRILKVNRNPKDAEDLVSVTISIRKDVVDNEKKFAIIQHDGEIRKDNESLDPAFYFAVNRISGSTRGMPDMLSTIDWLEGLDGLIFSMLERADISQDVVFDLEFAGLNAKELKEQSDKFADDLRAGGVWAHNEKAKLGIQTPNLGASDSEKIVSVLLRQIQAGTRLAGLFFGDAEDLTRSSASELATPVAKAIQGRQNFIKRMIKRVFRHQINEAKKANALSGVTDFRFEIEMPRVFLRDISTITDSLVSLGISLETAVTNRWITKEQAGAVYRSSLQQLGLTVQETDILEDETNGQEEIEEEGGNQQGTDEEGSAHRNRARTVNNAASRSAGVT